MRATLIHKKERYDATVESIGKRDQNRWYQAHTTTEGWKIALSHDNPKAFNIGDLAEIVLSTDAGETNLDAHHPGTSARRHSRSSPTVRTGILRERLAGSSTIATSKEISKHFSRNTTPRSSRTAMGMTTIRLSTRTRVAV